MKTTTEHKEINWNPLYTNPTSYADKGGLYTPGGEPVAIRTGSNLTSWDIWIGSTKIASSDCALSLSNVLNYHQVGVKETTQ